MEINFQNISLKNKNHYLFKDLNFKINGNEITGIIDEFGIVKKILMSEIEGSINYPKNKKIKYIEHDFLTKTVSDEFFLVKMDVNDNNYIEKIRSSLNLVGLNENYLEKEINTLSSSEKILITIALSIITNPDIIIFDNVFKYLDKKYKVVIKNLIKELKKNYQKQVIVIDNDINILYEICTYLIIFNNYKIVFDGKINDLLNNLDILDDNDIDIPFLVEFSNIALDYSKKINYYNNINDLVKEVYKNAK